MLEDRACRVATIGYTEEYGEFFFWIVLKEGRSETFVKAGLEAFDGADDRDMRRVCSSRSRRCGGRGIPTSSVVIRLMPCSDMQLPYN